MHVRCSTRRRISSCYSTRCGSSNPRHALTMQVNVLGCVNIIKEFLPHRAWALARHG